LPGQNSVLDSVESLVIALKRMPLQVCAGH
jgi:hypothetical protein